MYLKCQKPNIFLYFSAISANLTSFVVGCCLAWTYPAIPRLNGSTERSHNPLGCDATTTMFQELLITSLVPLGAAASSLFSGNLARTRGRKEVLVVSTLILMIGFGIMHFAHSVPYICLARIVCGLGIGATFTVVPMYVGEIAEDSNRGRLGMLVGLFLMMGVLFTCGVGSVVTLNSLNLINLAAPLVFMACFDWFVPESPYWLMSQNRPKDAEKSLRKLRISSEEKITNELAEIRKSVEEASKNRGGLKELKEKKEFLKAICIAGGLVLFQQLSGANVILFYMRSIFTEAGIGLSVELSAIIICVVKVISCLISLLCVDSLGRRFLLLLSTLCTSLSLISFGIYFYLKEISANVTLIYWLPFVSIVCFMVAYAAGLGPIPFVMLSEIFPQQIKSTATTIIIFLCLILTFCSTTLFPPLTTIVGMAYTFWIFAIFCFVGFLFVLITVPETKRRSLQEIQEILKK